MQSMRQSKRPHAIHTITRSDEALQRIGVTAQQLNEAPQITSLLKRAEGGLPQVLAAMRFSSDALVVTWLRKYDSIPVGDRERLSIEAIAVAAGVNINYLFGSIMMVLHQQSVNTSRIIAMTSHPKITEARVRYGLLPLGERDRTALDVAMGFLPRPKGPTFIGQAVFAGSNNGKAVFGSGDDNEEGELIDGDAVDLDKIFPAANIMQEKLTLIRQRIPPPPPAPPPSKPK
jgi:hypothetical protein